MLLKNASFVLRYKKELLMKRNGEHNLELDF